MPLDRDAAARAIEERVAKPLGISVEEAAAGIYDVINVAMATGVRDISVRRGLDPRDFPLVVAGGAGPVHAAAIAAELEIPLLVVPRESSIFCAAGMLMCDFKHDFVRSLKTTLGELDAAHLDGLLAEMAGAGRAILERERVDADRVVTQAALDLRYVGQWHELTVPIAAIDPATIAAAFHAQHDTLFGYSSPEMPIEVLAVAAHRDRLDREARVSDRSSHRRTRDPPSAARHPARVVGLAPGGSSRRPSTTGSRSPPGATLAGPAVVELANTTIVASRGLRPRRRPLRRRSSCGRASAAARSRRPLAPEAVRGVTVGVLGAGSLGQGFVASLVRAGLRDRRLRRRPRRRSRPPRPSEPTAAGSAADLARRPRRSSSRCPTRPRSSRRSTRRRRRSSRAPRARDEHRRARDGRRARRAAGRPRRRRPRLPRQRRPGPGGERGELAIMVGGTDAAFARGAAASSTRSAAPSSTSARSATERSRSSRTT